MSKFHMDTCVHRFPDLLRALRARNIDITNPNEIGLRTATDEAHLAFASKENRVLITTDRGFRDRHYAGEAHAGIIYWKPGSRSFRECLEFLVFVSFCCEHMEMRNHLEDYSPGNYSITQQSPEPQENSESLIAQHERNPRKLELSE